MGFLSPPIPQLNHLLSGFSRLLNLFGLTRIYNMSPVKHQNHGVVITGYVYNLKAGASLNGGLPE
jgi:hypothetical protein